MGEIVAKFDAAPSVRLLEADGGGAVIQGKAGVKIDPLRVSADLSALVADPAGLAWLNTALRGGSQVANGTVTQTDLSGNAQYTLTIEQAAVTRLHVGPLDVTERRPATVEVTLAPSRSQWTKGKGKVAGAANAKTKAMQSSNFRVKLDSLPTQRISEIGGIGGRRDDKSGAWACDTLELEVSMTDFDAWLAWHAEAVSGKANPRSMTIELLDPTMKDTLLTLQAQGVTILRADPGLSDGEVNRPGRVQLAVDSWSAK